MDITSQILPFLYPQFSVIIDMTGKDFVRYALKTLANVRTTFKRNAPFLYAIHVSNCQLPTPS